MRRSTLLVLLSGLTAGCGPSQPAATDPGPKPVADGAPSTPDEPAPEKQVAALSEQHRKAAIKGDTEALDAVLADDWVVVGPTGEVETRRQQAEKIKDGSLVFEAIDAKEVKVRVHGDTAVVMGLYHIKATVNGRTVDGSFRNTGVFAKQAGTWRCVFNQVTPVAPPAEKR